jgi:hypothetical protein
MHPSDMKGGQTINTTIGQPNHQHHDWPAKPSTPRLASETINITIGQRNHQHHDWPAKLSTPRLASQTINFHDQTIRPGGRYHEPPQVP